MEILKLLGFNNVAEMMLIMIFCVIFTQFVKVNTKMPNKISAIVSLIVGVCGGLISAAFYQESLLGGCILGFILGAAAAGLFSGVKGLAQVLNPENVIQDLNKPKTTDQTNVPSEPIQINDLDSKGGEAAKNNEVIEHD